MDGENNGKPENPMTKWMIWGYHYFRKHPFCREFFVEEKNKKQSSCGPCFYREIHLIQDSAVLKFLPNRWKTNTPLLEWTPKRVLFFFRVITCVFLLQEILAHVFLVSKDSACKVDRCHLILIFCIKFTSLLSFAFHLVGSNNTSTRNRNQPTKTKKKHHHSDSQQTPNWQLFWWMVVSNDILFSMYYICKTSRRFWGYPPTASPLPWTLPHPEKVVWMFFAASDIAWLGGVHSEIKCESFTKINQLNQDPIHIMSSSFPACCCCCCCCRHPFY